MSHRFADLPGQSGSLTETKSPILKHDPVWCYRADAELIHALDVLTQIILSDAVRGLELDNEWCISFAQG